jgi:NADP-dependent 3-hydroxy acid dehydrogenase YdfG
MAQSTTGLLRARSSSPFSSSELRSNSKETILKGWFIAGASRGFCARVAQKALAKGSTVVAIVCNRDTLTQGLGVPDNLLALKLDEYDSARTL